MSARVRTLSSGLRVNTTNEARDSRDVVYEYEVFNICLLSVSVCVLTVTAISCCVSYINRRRHRKRACEYESAVACDLEEDEPVNLKLVKRSQSSRNTLPPFQPPGSSRKHDSIYHIYTNLLAVRSHAHDDADPAYTLSALTLNDPEDGIILNPPTFYMQL